MTYNIHILSSVQRGFYSKFAESLSSVCIRRPFLRFLFLRGESSLKICQQHMYKYITRKTSHSLCLGQTKAEKAVPLRFKHVSVAYATHGANLGIENRRPPSWASLPLRSFTSGVHWTFQDRGKVKLDNKGSGAEPGRFCYFVCIKDTRNLTI